MRAEWRKHLLFASVAGKFLFVYGRWCTGALRQMYWKIDELSSSRVSPDQSGSQSNSELKDSNGKPAETLENNIQSRAEMNYIKGLKQHHSRVPPVSLQVHAKAYTGGGGCPTWSYLILDAFWYVCCSLLVNKLPYTPTVRIFMAKMVWLPLYHFNMVKGWSLMGGQGQWNQ